MKTANVAEFKCHLSEYLQTVAAGEQVQICKRHLAVAMLLPIKKHAKNRTVLGRGKGSVEVRGDLTDTVMDAKDWGMLKGDG